MKRFSKIIAKILVIVSAFCLCFSFSACGEDIVTMEVTVSVYNTSSGKNKDETLTVSLYRHFAKNTVNAIIDYAKAGYYNDAVFYTSEGSSQIMVGDLKFDNETKTVVQNLDSTGKLKDTIKGEFAKNNVPGSTLKNEEGTIGLWRYYYTKGFEYSDNARDSGRATWYMPITSISNYDSWFCLFAKVDLTDEVNKTTWGNIKTLFNGTETYEEMVIYYTGEYVADDSLLNNGLTFHCVTKAYYDDNKDDIEKVMFKADENASQYINYNLASIKVATDSTNKTNKKCGAYIKSIAIK